MRFVGIDVGAEKHVVAVVDHQSQVLLEATSVDESGAGYARLRELLGSPADTLVAMEATGHYWQNLFAALTADGFTISLLNPMRTQRFAGEDMLRAKTDSVDALSIARFGAQKRPVSTRLADAVTLELKELVRYRDRLVQDFGDKLRQLHRLVDLGFPEFTRYVKSLDSELASAILLEYPTARAMAAAKLRKLAAMRYDGRHHVGRELADRLIEAARTSVGAHHGYAYQLQIREICEDLGVLRRRIRQLDREVESTLDRHEVGKLLTSIDGIGSNTAARLIAELGDPARFRDAAALASYVGVVPATRHSGKHRPLRSPISHIGHARLRRALWMPLLTGVRKNPWLKFHYERLLAAGKLPKVALIACMRRLLVAVHVVAKNRRPFVPLLPAATTP